MISIPIRKIHKWFAIVASAVLLAWVVSGFVMVIPYRYLARMAGMTPTATASATTGDGASGDYRDFKADIPEAIAALEERLGKRAEIGEIRIRMFQGRPAYEIRLLGGAARLVDGLTGSPIEIDRALAEQLARSAVPAPGNIATVVQIDRREFHYRGALPAYKIQFDDPSGYVVYVSENGDVIPTSRLSRLNRWIISLHGLEPLRLVYDSNRFRVATLLLFSGFSLLVVVSGIYLALPARWRARRVAVRRV